MPVQIAAMEELLRAQLASEIPYIQMFHLSMRNRIVPSIAHLAAFHTRPIARLRLPEIRFEQILMFAFSQLRRLRWIVLAVLVRVRLFAVHTSHVFVEGTFDDECLLTIDAFVVFVVHRLLVVGVRPTIVEHGVALFAVDDGRIYQVHGFAVILVGVPVTVRLVTVVNFADVPKQTNKCKSGIQLIASFLTIA